MVSGSDKLTKILFFINAIIFVYGIRHYFSLTVTGRPWEYSVWLFILIPVAYWIQMKGRKSSASARKYGMLYGSLFAVAMVCGREIDIWNSLVELYNSMLHFLWAIVRTASFALIVGYVSAILLDPITCCKKSILNNRLWEKHTTSLFFVLWGIILLAWLPAYFAYYPGIGDAYDLSDQIGQALGGFSSYSKHHPPLHTWLIALSISLGERTETAAITVYARMQMLFLSWVMARLNIFLYRRKAPAGLCVFTFLFSAMNPVLAVFSLIPVKDAVFGGFFVLFSIKVYELTSDTGQFFSQKRNGLSLAIDGLLCCLLRNNMIYALIPFAVIILTAIKADRKKIGIMMGGVILTYFLVNDGLYPALGMREGGAGEKLCVPVQQIASVVYHEDWLTDEDRSYIEVYLPLDRLQELYNPRNADPVKNTFLGDEYRKDAGRFWKGYFRMAKAHPLRYLDAFLALNLPYWYPDADTIDRYSQRDYIETRIGTDAYEESKAPKLLALYEQVADFSAFSGKPVWETLFSITTPLWLMLFCLFAGLCGRNKKRAVTVMAGILLWLTYIAGPVSNFRYIFAMFLAYPLYLMIALNPEEGEPIS